jgi:DNA-binding MarR family transcriptional regulator
MNDMMDSIKAHLYDRVASPLLGAYALAWSVWNYRVIVILLSSQSPSWKFLMIEQRFSLPFLDQYISIAGGAIHGLIIPAVLAALYIYAYPAIARPVYEHSLEKQRELKAIKQAQEAQILLSPEDSAKIYLEMSRLQGEHDDEVENLRKQLTAQRDATEELEKAKREHDQAAADLRAKVATYEAQFEGSKAENKDKLGLSDLGVHDDRVVYPGRNGVSDTLTTKDLNELISEIPNGETRDVADLMGEDNWSLLTPVAHDLINEFIVMQAGKSKIGRAVIQGVYDGLISLERRPEGETGLTKMEAKVLTFMRVGEKDEGLRRFPSPPSLKALAHSLKLDLPILVSILQVLESKKYVVREKGNPFSDLSIYRITDRGEFYVNNLTKEHVSA